MSTLRKIPRIGQQVDFVCLSTAVDWTDPTEMEIVLLSDRIPDAYRLLQEVEADPELALLQWHEGETVLHIAASYNALELAGRLLELGAFVNAGDGQIGTPLHRAIEYNHTAVTDLLLKHNANPNSVDGVSRTPLHYAALGNNSDAIKLLLGHGADVGKEDRDGLSAYDLAISNGCAQVAGVLLENSIEENQS